MTDERTGTHTPPDHPPGWRELFAERLKNEVEARVRCEMDNSSSHKNLWHTVRDCQTRLTKIEQARATEKELSKSSKGDLKWVVTTGIALIALIASVVSALT